MSLDNIKDLIADGHTIGCHSYYHTKIWELPSLNRQVVHLKTDTELMLKWFKDELNITPYHYAIPYEQDLDGMYQMILSKYDFKFYGMGRVNIDDILV
jgi:peptidoglycan/xylan/chitin deacetylase (PgdA/CDA1 family)